LRVDGDTAVGLGEAGECLPDDVGTERWRRGRDVSHRVPQAAFLVGWWKCDFGTDVVVQVDRLDVSGRLDLDQQVV
jgi:hypothetical protein